MKTGTAASMPANMRTGVLFTEFRAVSRGGDQPKARQLPTEYERGRGAGQCFEPKTSGENTADSGLGFRAPSL